MGLYKGSDSILNAMKIKPKSSIYIWSSPNTHNTQAHITYIDKPKQVNMAASLLTKTSKHKS